MDCVGSLACQRTASIHQEQQQQQQPTYVQLSTRSRASCCTGPLKWGISSTIHTCKAHVSSRCRWFCCVCRYGSHPFPISTRGKHLMSQDTTVSNNLSSPHSSAQAARACHHHQLLLQLWVALLTAAAAGASAEQQFGVTALTATRGQHSPAAVSQAISCLGRSSLVDYSGIGWLDLQQCLQLYSFTTGVGMTGSNGGINCPNVRQAAIKCKHITCWEMAPKTERDPCLARCPIEQHVAKVVMHMLYMLLLLLLYAPADAMKCCILFVCLFASLRVMCAGYWAQDWTRVEPHYGTEQDLKNLIRAAHKRGGWASGKAAPPAASASMKAAAGLTAG